LVDAHPGIQSRQGVRDNRQTRKFKAKVSMLDTLISEFNSVGFMPHGHCFLWTPSLLWSYVAADSLIAVSYYSIPFALWYFAKKRADVPFRWLFALFGVFVMACGTTHLLAIWNIWEPHYWLDASVKILTAIASIVTALLLWPLIPKALAIPSQAQLTRANRELSEEVARRVQAEAQLRRINDALQERTEELLGSNRKLESFSYSISHDLRAPVRAIHGFTTVLGETAGAKLTDDERRVLDRIMFNATHMGKLIDDILNFSRLSSAAMSAAPVDMEALAREVVDEVQTEYPGAVITIGRLPSAAGDRALLRQALLNLVANALKFSSKRALPRVEIGFEEHGGEAPAYFVRDNGVGFDMQYANRLFGIFQRVHSVTEFPGTGVGLAIVRNVIERHHGQVWVQAAPDQGATFFFSLPGAEQAAAH
jgi:signal transduction histidine kinase